MLRVDAEGPGLAGWVGQRALLTFLCLRSTRCQFSTFEQCQEWLKRLGTVVRPPSRLEDLFSFAFHAWCMNVYAGEKEQHSELCRPGASSPPSQQAAAAFPGVYVLLLSFRR